MIVYSNISDSFYKFRMICLKHSHYTLWYVPSSELTYVDILLSKPWFEMRTFFLHTVMGWHVCVCVVTRGAAGGGGAAVVTSNACHIGACGIQVSKIGFFLSTRKKNSIVGRLHGREVACSASDHQESYCELFFCRAVSSNSPQHVLLVHFSMYMCTKVARWGDKTHPIVGTILAKYLLDCHVIALTLHQERKHMIGADLMQLNLLSHHYRSHRFRKHNILTQCWMNVRPAW